jgi:hypothetical protein
MVEFVIVWQLDLQLPMKSVPITNKFFVSFESLPPLSKGAVMVMIVW